MLRTKTLHFIFILTLFLAPPVQAQIEKLPDFADMAEQVQDAVVNVDATQLVKNNPYDLFSEFFGRRGMPGMPGMQEMPQQQRKAKALGTGFIIDEAGYIVTNFHVVEDAKEINITLQDKSKLKAKLIGGDKKTDIAVLKVETKKKLKALKWAKSDPRVGSWVVAMGYPFRLGLTVTKGIVSAVGRNVTGAPFEDFIQTDAAVNMGNSGGPLMNLHGEVIGINAALISPTGAYAGVSFAISGSMAQPIIEGLRKDGKIRRGWVGVAIETLRPAVAKSMKLDFDKGVLVANVGEDTPAEKAGIKPGDIIVEYNGTKVEEGSDLIRDVASTEIGKEVPIKVYRSQAGKQLTLKIKVGDRDKAEDEGHLSDPGQKSSKRSVNKSGNIEEIGVKLSPMTPDLRSRYNIPRGVNGVVVVDIDISGPARGRLNKGDVITKAAQKKVKSIDDVEEAVKAAKENEHALTLWTNRAGSENFITIDLVQNFEELGG